MNTVMRLKNYKQSEATLEVTMTIGEWIELRSQLENSYPSWKLSNEISSVINKIETTFRPDIQENK